MWQHQDLNSGIPDIEILTQNPLKIAWSQAEISVRPTSPDTHVSKSQHGIGPGSSENCASTHFVRKIGKFISS